MASERSPIQRSADSLPVQQEYLPSGFADSEVHPQSTFLKNYHHIIIQKMNNYRDPDILGFHISICHKNPQ